MITLDELRREFHAAPGFGKRSEEALLNFLVARINALEAERGAFREILGTHLCTECGGYDDNPHSTSMCRDCQIVQLMHNLDDCEKPKPHMTPNNVVVIYPDSEK